MIAVEAITVEMIAVEAITVEMIASCAHPGGVGGQSMITVETITVEVIAVETITSSVDPGGGIDALKTFHAQHGLATSVLCNLSTYMWEMFCVHISINVHIHMSSFQCDPCLHVISMFKRINGIKLKSLVDRGQFCF